MKKTIRSLFSAAMLVAASLQTHGQGFIYDQQSATGPTSPPADDFFNIQTASLTQSFMPTLSAIGFVQFQFWDIPGNGNNGATVYVKLWTGSPNINSATLLGSTTPVYMPNGFVNSSLGFAGITNFYFSTPITLTPGQTYYLQPVVLSGDNPWDIAVLANTYSGGQLYANGGLIQPSSDFWFREGIVSVPEPSTLTMIGLSSLLVFYFKRRSKLVILFLFAISVFSLHAVADSVVQATAAEAGLAPSSATVLPESGTFWVMTVDSDGNLIESPYPVLPPDLSGLPIYSVTNDIYMVDGTGGQLASASTGRMSRAQAASIAQAQAATTASLIEQMLDDYGTNGEYQPYGFTPMIYTNGLWLEILNTNSVTTNLWLRLHGTVGGDNYQLLSSTNLSDTNWNLGQILFGASDGYADFSAVPITNKMTLFRAHHANPVMEIYNSQYAIEPNPTNSDPGQVGTFYIQNESWATNDVTVYYTIGGTAQNGIDYSNLTGIATVPLNQAYAEIDIDPIADGLKPDQTIVLTLMQNTNYLIDPAYHSATNALQANPQVYPIAFGDNLPPMCPNTTNNITLRAAEFLNLPLAYTILTWPTHGTLHTNGAPYVTYAPTNCYEGTDSFTFKVNDGQFDSAPATVNLIISDPVNANAVYPQTCRGTPVSIALSGGDQCGETLGYAVLSNPAHGTLSGTATNLTYTPTGTNFTGTDTFNYMVYSGCGGDFATNSVTITVGDATTYPNPQSVMTGTNRAVAISLSAADFDNCNADTNYYTYTVTSNPPTVI